MEKRDAEAVGVFSEAVGVFSETVGVFVTASLGLSLVENSITMQLSLFS